MGQLRDASIGLLIVASYVATGIAGLSVHPVGGFATLIWPPSGIAVASLLILGMRFWPAVFISAFIVNASMGVPLLGAVGIGFGNTLEAVFVSYLWGRDKFKFDLNLLRPSDVLRFVIYACSLSPLLAATVGSLSLRLCGIIDSNEFMSTFIAWWQGDMLGILIVASLIFQWKRFLTPMKWLRAIEFMGFNVLVVIVAFACFGLLHFYLVGEGPTFYLFTPILLWSAYRYGHFGVMSSILILSVIGFVSVVAGKGLFAVSSVGSSLMALQVYLALMTATGLFLAASFVEARRLSNIVDSAADSIVAKTLDGIILTWNESSKNLYGYDASEVIGRDMHIVIPPEGRKDFESYMSKVRSGNKIVVDSAERLKKDGSRIQVSLSISPIKDVTGHVIGASTIARNISEIKKQEEHDSLLASIVTQSNEAIVGTGVDNSIKSWNQAAQEIFEYSFDDVVGKPISLLVPSDKLTESKVLSHQVMCGASIRDHETTRISKSGKKIPVAINISGHFNNAGKITGYSYIFRNLTTLHAIIEQLKKTDRLKDEFFSTLSHEIRTPMSAILGFSDLLQKSEPDSTVFKTALEAIQRSTRSQAKIVSDILDLSRITSGKLNLNVTRFKLGSILNGAIESVSFMIKSKGLNLQTNFLNTDDFLMGDPDRLQQVLWNILSNAAKFTPANGFIKFEAEKRASRFFFSISDSGIGIEKEFIPYVFDRYLQADSSSKRHFGGLGIGMAIAKTIVEMHGGEITVSSAGSGKGTTFQVELPSQAVYGEPGPLQHTPVPENDHVSADPEDNVLDGVLDGKHILIIDDREDLRELVSGILQSAGAAVLLADSVETGMALALGDIRPDVVICDIGMPVKDGFDFIKELRSTEIGKSLPAIALTAYVSEKDKYKVLDAGFQVFLAKPTESTVLIRAVSKLCA